MSDQYESDEPMVRPTATLEEETVGGEKTTRALLVGGAVVAVVLFAGFIWYAWDQSRGKGVIMPPPVVRAEQGPAKVEPESPGGMDVPHQDKLVYERLDSESEERVEQLLPPPEAPASSLDEVEGLASDAELLAESGPVALPDDTASDLLPLEDESDEPPAAEVSTPAEITPQSFLLQLYSVQSEERANAGWERLKARHGELMAGLAPDVQRADLGERGVFYRLRIGPFTDRASAEALCAQLKERGQDCLVARP